MHIGEDDAVSRTTFEKRGARIIFRFHPFCLPGTIVNPFVVFPDVLVVSVTGYVADDTFHVAVNPVVNPVVVVVVAVVVVVIGVVVGVGKTAVPVLVVIVVVVIKGAPVVPIVVVPSATTCTHWRIFYSICNSHLLRNTQHKT